MKRCKACGKDLPESDFRKRTYLATGNTGLESVCRKCRSARIAQRAKEKRAGQREATFLPIRKCRVCGRLFKGKESQCFCSTSCRKKAKAARDSKAKKPKPERKVSTEELKEKMRRRWLASVE